jgi:hypothetical protein
VLPCVQVTDVKAPGAGSGSGSSRGKTARPVLERVAGSGKDGRLDGPLDECQFQMPYGLCRFEDLLIVTEDSTRCIRAVDGVLGVPNPLGPPSEYEARVAALIMTAVPELLKELVRLMAQYAQPRSGTRTIAGSVR